MKSRIEYARSIWQSVWRIANLVQISTSKFSKLYKERPKRGFIKVLWTAGKYLFGTMYPNDRKSIKDKLENLNSENLKRTKFNFKNATLIDEAMSQISSTISSCNKSKKHNNVVYEETLRQS